MKKGANKYKKAKKPAAKTQDEIDEENIMKAQVVLTHIPLDKPIFRYIPDRNCM